MDYTKLIIDITKALQDAFPLPAFSDPTAVGSWAGKVVTDLSVIAKELGGLDNLKAQLITMNNQRLLSPGLFSQHLTNCEACGGSVGEVSFILQNIPAIISLVEALMQMSAVKKITAPASAEPKAA